MSTQMVETKSEIRRHELLADMAEQVATRLIKKHGITEDIALDVGNDLADYLSDHWKGQNIYINSDSKYKLSKRDLLIYEKMGRGNAHEIGREMGISYVHVYQVYKRVLAIFRAKNQPRLFEDQLAKPKELSTAKKAGV